MTTCIGEPVSYLRLERYELRELPAEEHQRVAEHLAQCATCRACYERLHADAREHDVAALHARLQRPRPQPKAAQRWRSWLWAPWALAASAAVVVLSVLVRQEQAVPPDPPGTKGDGLAIELIRVDARGELLPPTHFAPGDRFKVAVSCPPALAGPVTLLVFQQGQAFTPFQLERLESCGNRRVLQGAFELDGDAPVDVCVVFGAIALRAAQERDALPEPHVCTHVARVVPAP